jgi:hypothetical protein
MCGGNLYNHLLRQELDKQKHLKPVINEQPNINEITNEHPLIKAIRKFGRTFQTRHVQHSSYQYAQY